MCLEEFGLSRQDQADQSATLDSTDQLPPTKITKLSKRQRDQLFRLGLISGPDDSPPGEPVWNDVKTYYWMQTFPPHKVLHVRHEYTPSVGFEEIPPRDLDPKKPHASDIRGQIENACVDPSLQKELTDQATKNYKACEETLLGVAWVDTILTTANSQKTPIKDFTLIIGRRRDSQHDSGAGMQYVSLCWDGPVKKLNADHFLACARNQFRSQEGNPRRFLSLLWAARQVATFRRIHWLQGGRSLRRGLCGAGEHGRGHQQILVKGFDAGEVVYR